MSPTSSHVLVERLRGVLGPTSVDDHVLIQVIGDSLLLRWVGSSVITGPDDPVDALYVVMSGAVEVVDDDEQIDELEPGATFGGKQVIHSAPHEHTYVAAPDCELLVIPRGPLLELLDEDPTLARRLEETSA